MVGLPCTPAGIVIQTRQSRVHTGGPLMAFSKISGAFAAKSGRLRGRRWAHLRGLGAAGLMLAFVGSVALIAPQAASAAAKDAPHAVSSSSFQKGHDVAGFPGTSTTAPFNECPAIGWDNSCGIVIVISNNGEQVLQDPNNATSTATFTTPGAQTPYDENDDTLVGHRQRVQQAGLRAPAVRGVDREPISSDSTVTASAPTRPGEPVPTMAPAPVHAVPCGTGWVHG